MSRSFAANNVSGALSTGAFVGATSATSYTENHFVLDSGLAAVGQDNGGNTDLTTDITGDTLANLQAATAPGVPNAAFFTTWSTDIWDFGDATQLPGLIIGDEVFRGDALTPVISESAARGLALYTPMCSGCHGADGQGSPPINLFSTEYPTGRPSAVPAVQYVEVAMPLANPGSCVGECAVDIVAYLRYLGSTTN